MAAKGLKKEIPHGGAKNDSVDSCRMIYGVDMYGNVCGQNNEANAKIPEGMRYDLSDRPMLYWPNPLDLNIQLCLPECPQDKSQYFTPVLLLTAAACH